MQDITQHITKSNRSRSTEGTSATSSGFSDYARAKEIDYPQESLLVILLFCGYVIIWYLQLGGRIESLGKIRFEFLYATFLSLVAILFSKKVDLKSPLLPYIIIYFLALIIQIPFSQDFNTSWNVFLNRIVKFAFLSGFIIVFVKSPRDLKFFLGAFLLACGKMGEEGFLGTITGSLMWENQGIMRLHGVTSLYRDPNSFTGMALGTLPFVWYLWPISKSYWKICLGVLGLFSVNIILHTGSRTGYVGFLTFLLFVLIQSEHRKKLVAGLIVTTILISPYIPRQYIERFQSTYTLKEKEGHSAETRIQILKDAWKIFVQHPFGVGVAAFPAVREKTFGRIQDTHNLYLQVATNLGIQGFIVFFLFVFKMLKMLRQLYLSFSSQINRLNSIQKKDSYTQNHIENLRLMEATTRAVFLFVLVRLTLGFFGMDLYEIYWWFAFGLTISLSNMHKIAEGIHLNSDQKCS